MLAARRPVRGLLVGRMFARAFCVGGLMMVFVGGLGLFAGSRIGVVEAVIGLAGVFLLAVAAVLWVLCGIGEWLQGLDGG